MTTLRLWALLAALVVCLLGPRRAEAQPSPANMTPNEDPAEVQPVHPSRELGMRPCDHDGRTCAAWDVGGNAQIGRFFLRAQELVERTSGRRFIERRDWWNWRVGDMRRPFDPRPRRSGELPPILNRSGEADYVSLDLLIAINDGSTVGNSMMASAYCNGRRAYPLRFGTSAINRSRRVTEPVTLQNVERLMPARCHWNGISLIDRQILLLPTTGGLTAGQRIDALISTGTTELDAGRVSLNRILQDSQAYSALANRPHVVVEVERRQAFEVYRTRGMQLAAQAEARHDAERAALAARVRDLEARLGGAVPSTLPAMGSVAPTAQAPSTASSPTAFRGSQLTSPPWRLALELAMGLALIGFVFQAARDRNRTVRLPKDAFDEGVSGASVRVSRWYAELREVLQRENLPSTGVLHMPVPQVRHLCTTLWKAGDHEKELFAKIEEIGKENERLREAMPMVKTDITGVLVSKDMLPQEKPETQLFLSPAESVRQSMTDVGAFDAKLKRLERETKSAEERVVAAEKAKATEVARAKQAEADGDAWKKRAEAAESVVEAKNQQVEELQAEVALLKTRLEEQVDRVNAVQQHCLENLVELNGPTAQVDDSPEKPLNGHAVPAFAIGPAPSPNPPRNTIPGPGVAPEDAPPMPKIPKMGELPSIFAEDDPTDVHTLPNLASSGMREILPQSLLPTAEEGDKS